MEKKLLFVRAEKSWDDYKKGESYEVDAVTAETWIKAGFASAIDNQNQVQELIAKLEKAVEDSQKNTIEAITKAVQKEVKIPATPKQDDKSFDDFLRGVARNDKEYLNNKYSSKYEHLDEKNTKSMSTLSGLNGGYLIPDEFSKEIYSVPSDATFVKERASVYPISGNTFQMPAIQQTTNQFGGMLVYHKEEGLAGVESSPKFRSISLRLKDIIALSVTTNDMLDDAGFDLGAYLTKNSRDAIGMEAEYRFLVGDGVSGALGVKNSGAALTVARNTVSHIKGEDITGMRTKLSPTAIKNACWVAHQTTMGDIRGLKDGAGNYCYLPNLSVGGTPTLDGLPIFWTGCTSALGTAGDLMLVDFSSYLITEKPPVVAFSEHYKYAENESAFRIVYRYDGCNALDAPVKLKDGVTEVSNIVVLGDHA